MLGLDISVSTALAESKIAIITGRQVHTALLCLQYLRNSEPARKHWRNASTDRQLFSSGKKCWSMEAGKILSQAECAQLTNSDDDIQVCKQKQ